MFKKGDYVVKANTGICIVDDIIMKQLSESFPAKEYYVLIPLNDEKAKLFVPTASDASNLRVAMNEEAAWDLIRSIPEIEIKWIESDRTREKEYKEVIKSNDPASLVSIIKNIYLRNREREEQGKKVTSVDDRYFKLAESTLYSELAHALGKECADMRAIINDTIEGIL
ncbi:MAG: CarD family transcriptional regulator [Lachnospiraceae bacterium]|nr:CarD family transcriptional regulator [Lachnospiraceae bacterium]